MSDDTWDEAVCVLVNGNMVVVTNTLEAAECLFRGWPDGSGEKYDATIKAFASALDESEPHEIARIAFLQAAVQDESNIQRP